MADPTGPSGPRGPADRLTKVAESLGGSRRRPSKGGGGGRSRRAASFEGAFEASFSVLVAGGMGYGIDQYFGTEPIGVLSGVVLGFAAMVVRLVRLGTEIEKLSEAEEQAARDSEREN